MLNINFEVNEEVILIFMIQRRLMPTDFANYLLEKYNDSCELLKKYENSYTLVQKAIYNNEIDLNIFEEIKQQPFFNRIVKMAQENCERIKSIWENKKDEINNFLTNIAKTDFLLENKAYIVPSSFCRGVNIGNNCFIWGHRYGLENENYDLVYLVHESLHSIFPKGDICHAIIENIADIELCKYLNKTKVGYETHKKKGIQEAHAQILPYWNLYLNKSVEEIEEEQKLLNTTYDINEFEPYRDELSKMNMVEFTNFVLALNANKIETDNNDFKIIS